MLSSRPKYGSKQQTSSASDDLFTKRYKLSHPPDVFSYNGSLPFDQSLIDMLSPPTSNTDSIVSNYPDFIPWSHNKQEDGIAANSLQKGCVERQIVNNELRSGRNTMQNSLKASVLTSDGNSTKSIGLKSEDQISSSTSNISKSSVTSLSNYMLEAINKRNKFNRISSNSSFKPPPRVTLTEQKKELWLKNLADSSISLRKLSRTIPHGIRNKTLLDQLVSKRVPVNRAIWFIKCIGLNELRQLKRKGGNLSYNENSIPIGGNLGSSNEIDNNEMSWINEWTKQLIDYLENTFTGTLVGPESLKYQEANDLEDVFTSLSDSSSMKYKIFYLNNLIHQLFAENLINKKLFLTILISKILPSHKCGTLQITNESTNNKTTDTNTNIVNSTSATNTNTNANKKSIGNSSNKMNHTKSSNSKDINDNVIGGDDNHAACFNKSCDKITSSNASGSNPQTCDVDNRNFYQTYILLTVFIKGLMGHIVKNFIMENYYSKNQTAEDLSSNDIDDRLFYTNLLRQLIENLILKYDFIHKCFTPEIVLANNGSVATTKNINSDTKPTSNNSVASSSNTPLSAYSKAGMTPIHPVSATVKTPSSLFFNSSNNNGALSSPYGLNSINSPFQYTFANNYPDAEKNNSISAEKDRNSGSILDSNDESMIKLHQLVKKLRKVILVSIKVILMNLFVLNNGELFILPKKNWSLLKKILLTYNILNTKQNFENLIISSNHETKKPNDDDGNNKDCFDGVASGSEASSTFANSPNPRLNEKTKQKNGIIMSNAGTPTSGNIGSTQNVINSSNILIDQELYSANCQEKVSDDLDPTNSTIITDSNSILKHGINFDISHAQENFIIQNNSRIVLKKQFEVISSRNDALFNNISNSFKDLYNFEKKALLMLNNETSLNGKENFSDTNRKGLTSNAMLKDGESNTKRLPGLFIIKPSNSKSICNANNVYLKIVNSLFYLLNYDFFYLVDLKSVKSVNGNLKRSFSITSNNSNASTPVSKRPPMILNPKNYKAAVNEAATSVNPGFGNPVAESSMLESVELNSFTEKIDELISLVFYDFKQITSIMSRNGSNASATPKLGSMGNNINCQETETKFNSNSDDAVLKDIRKRLHILLKFSVVNLSKEAISQSLDIFDTNTEAYDDYVAGNMKRTKDFKKVYLVIYIIKQSINKFKSVLAVQYNGNNNVSNEGNTNSGMDGALNKPSPSSLYPSNSSAIVENEDNSPTISSTTNDPNIIKLVKKQASNNFKAFLQNEILQFIFHINNNYAFFKNITDMDNGKSSPKMKSENSNPGHDDENFFIVLQSIMGETNAVDNNITMIGAELIEKLVNIRVKNSENNSKIITNSVENYMLSLSTVNLEPLFYLISSLFDSKLLSLTTYIRKLISSGILYLKSLKSYYDLNLLQYLILRNVGNKINANGTINNNNNIQLNLILKNLKDNLVYYINHQPQENSNSKFGGLLNINDRLLVEELFKNIDEPTSSLIISKIETGKKLLTEKVINSFFDEGNDHLTTELIELKSLFNMEVAIKNHLANWLYYQFQQRLLNNGDKENLLLTVSKLSITMGAFSKLNKLDYFFNIIRIILTININSDFALSGISPSASGNFLVSNTLKEITFGYHELYYILNIIWYNHDMINYLTDYLDIKIHFESKYSLIIKSIKLKPGSSVKEYSNICLKTVDFLKLVVNNYLKLNDIATNLYGGYSNSPDNASDFKLDTSMRMVNSFDFIKFWKYFYNGLDNYESHLKRESDNHGGGNSNVLGNKVAVSGFENSTLNNVKNQLAYLTTEPLFYFSSVEQSSQLSEFHKLILQVLKNCDLEIDVESFFNTEEIINVFQKLMEAFVNFAVQSNIDNRKVIKMAKLLLLLRKSNAQKFDFLTAKYVHKKALDITEENYFTIVKIFYHLIIHELIDFKGLFESLLKANVDEKTENQNKKDDKNIKLGKNDKTHPKQKLNVDTSDQKFVSGKGFELSSSFKSMVNHKNSKILCNLFYDILNDEKQCISLLSQDYDYQMLQIRKEFFKSENLDDFYELMLLVLFNEDHKELLISKSSYKEKCLEFFVGASEKHLDLITEKIIYSNSVDNEELFGICKTILYCSINEIDDSKMVYDKEDLYKIMNVVNEKNLPICQLIISIAFNLEAKRLNNHVEEIRSFVRQVLLKFLTYCFAYNIAKKPCACIAVVGDLFLCLRDDLKLIMLNEVEVLFLRSHSFPKLSLITDSHGVFFNNNYPDFGDNKQGLSLVNKYNNFVPYVAVIIDSISRSLSTMSGIPIANEIFTQSLAISLEKILKFLFHYQQHHKGGNHYTTTQEGTVSKSIYVFLKILSLHKVSIIHLLNNRHPIMNEKFVGNLVILLKTKFFIKHKQLRNILYDFLFSVKSNLNELNRLRTASIRAHSQQPQNPHNPTNINFVLPKLNYDNLNVELTKGLLLYLNDNDELISQSNDKLYNDLILHDKTAEKYYDLSLKPFDFLEDSNPIVNINDSSINLKYFGATIDRKNPA
ncbi:Srb8 protein [Saccharomycopsis crataegensis]|uniref:Mediator of RNA polymerase II transcription subunit 12 n=1 Tax=Saccharomycopsis crataegensis TaxID=43959 RepID=A0AAV5QMZ4_9ASCO|nr:Srb8 protein [Saccharomycopsis crataegensis]